MTKILISCRRICRRTAAVLLSTVQKKENTTNRLDTQQLEASATASEAQINFQLGSKVKSRVVAEVTP
jgi:hypothetical protein